MILWNGFTKGHTLIIVDNAERWAEFLADKEVLDYRGSKKLGTAWYGGNFSIENILFLMDCLSIVSLIGNINALLLTTVIV